MPKPINLAQYEKEIMAYGLRTLKNFLSKGNACGTHVKLDIDISNLFKKDNEEANAVLQFTPEAYLKMQIITNSTRDEIAAHGLVSHEEGTNVYTIYDMLMYPQTVTGATVNATPDYDQWLAHLPDEQFNALRFQFHSHGTMGVHPSGVDEGYMESMLKMVKDYFIFIIFNQQEKMHARIYDIKANLMYEDKDIDVYILLDGGELSHIQWLAQSKKMVATHTTTYPAAGASVSAIGGPKGGQRTIATPDNPYPNSLGKSFGSGQVFEGIGEDMAENWRHREGYSGYPRE
jgi:hypothetical protein